MSIWQKPFRGAQLNKIHPLARGLVGCWIMNEASGNKLFDLSGFGNHGTAQNIGADGGWRGGRTGPAFLFDGVNDYVDVSDDNSLRPNQITISVWVRISVSSRNGIVSKELTLISLKGYNFFVYSDDNFYFDLGDGNANRLINSFPTGNYGKWVNLIGTYDGTIQKAYLNGVLLGNTLSWTGAISYTPNRDVSIGTYIGEAGGEFDGLIDDVRIWNRALTAQEVMRLYLEPYAMFEPLPSFLRYFPIIIPSVTYKKLDIVPLLLGYDIKAIIEQNYNIEASILQDYNIKMTKQDKTA